MRRLMWFRSDLRLDDNPALRSACHQATEGVIAVFAVTPQQWAAHHWGDAKVSFVMRHVSELRAALEKINIPLKILRSNTFDMIPDQLLRLARSHHCHRLCFNAEWEVHEQYRDQQTTQKFEAAGLEVLCTRDQTLIRPDDLKTGSGGYYTVFTPFKKKWLAMASQQAAETPLGAPPRQKAIAVKADPLPDRHKGFRPCPAIDALWPAGEREAHRRLKCFLKDHADRYHIQRDRPDRAGTSSLSAYLAAGVISIRRVFCAAVKANRGRFSGGRKGLDLWISELIWREFYRHVLVGFPRVCRNQAFKRQSESLPWSNSPELFAAWCAGRTGFPIVDAGMRQLNATGWMHNRLRMITAMFLTKDLLIDWRSGERYFAQTLVDLDFASNNGGWQWSASTGTDAVPYFRIFNPTSQSRKFDPDGTYLRQWVPELASLNDKDIHDPPVNVRGNLGYPAPMVDHATARRRTIAAFKALK